MSVGRGKVSNYDSISSGERNWKCVCCSSKKSLKCRCEGYLFPEREEVVLLSRAASFAGNAWCTDGVNGRYWLCLEKRGVSKSSRLEKRTIESESLSNGVVVLKVRLPHSQRIDSLSLCPWSSASWNCSSNREVCPS